MRPRHFDRPCAVCSQDPIGMSKSFREALRFLLATLRALSLLYFSIEDFLWKSPWPVHLGCAIFKTVYMLCIHAFFRTSVSGILSCHLIFNSFLKQLKWKLLSLCMGRGNSLVLVLLGVYEKGWMELFSCDQQFI